MEYDDIISNISKMLKEFYPAECERYLNDEYTIGIDNETLGAMTRNIQGYARCLLDTGTDVPPIIYINLMCGRPDRFIAKEG